MVNYAIVNILTYEVTWSRCWISYNHCEIDLLLT